MEHTTDKFKKLNIIAKKKDAFRKAYAGLGLNIKGLDELICIMIEQEITEINGGNIICSNEENQLGVIINVEDGGVELKEETKEEITRNGDTIKIYTGNIKEYTLEPPHFDIPPHYFTETLKVEESIKKERKRRSGRGDGKNPFKTE